jgi:hypothetical protein
VSSNARNTEQVTALLHEATGKLADVLAVEVEIDRVRGEIERMAAEEKTLVKRVDLSTLNVNVREDALSQLQVARFRRLSRTHSLPGDCKLPNVGILLHKNDTNKGFLTPPPAW